MIKVAVFGSTGYIGRGVCEALVARGISVIALSRTPMASEIPGLTNIWFGRGFELVSLPRYRELLCDVQIVVDCSWSAGSGDYLISDENFNSFETLRFILNLTRSLGIPRFVSFGTCLEYKASFDPHSIEDELSPTSTYGKIKVAAFYWCDAFCKFNNIKFRWLRIFNIYGGFNEKSYRLYPHIINKIKLGEPLSLRNPYDIRDFIEYSDAMRIVVDRVLDDNIGASNICTGMPKTVMEFALETLERNAAPDLLGPLPSGNQHLACSIVGVPDTDE